MNSIRTLSLALLMSAYGLAYAQSGDMTTMNKQSCMDMKGMDMKGMDMKGMDDKKCMEMMHGNDSGKNTSANEHTVHNATAVVKSANPAKGTVTLAHEPVKTLKWPAMTMNFLVKDTSLFDKLTANKKVDVEFVKEGSDYVVTKVN